MYIWLYQSNFQNPHWQNFNDFIIYITNICHFKFHRRYMKKMHALNNQIHILHNFFFLIEVKRLYWHFFVNDINIDFYYN